MVKNPPTCGRRRRDGSIPGSGRSSRGGDGNPPQHSSLESSLDRGATVAVRGVPKGQTHLAQQLEPPAPRFRSSGLRASGPGFQACRLPEPHRQPPGAPASRCRTLGLLSLIIRNSTYTRSPLTSACLPACLSVCLSIYLSLLLALFLWRPLIKAVTLFCMIQYRI